jgi:hypothetical protein
MQIYSCWLTRFAMEICKVKDHQSSSTEPSQAQSLATGRVIKKLRWDGRLKVWVGSRINHEILLGVIPSMEVVRVGIRLGGPKRARLGDLPPSPNGGKTHWNGDDDDDDDDDCRLEWSQTPCRFLSNN